VGSAPTGKLTEHRYDSKAPEDVRKLRGMQHDGDPRILLKGLLNSLIGLSTILSFALEHIAIIMYDGRIRSKLLEAFALFCVKSSNTHCWKLAFMLSVSIWFDEISLRYK
jgi:hypothetical protein